MVLDIILGTLSPDTGKLQLVSSLNKEKLRPDWTVRKGLESHAKT